jgi:hypothetical protein
MFPGTCGLGSAWPVDDLLSIGMCAGRRDWWLSSPRAPNPEAPSAMVPAPGHTTELGRRERQLATTQSGPHSPALRRRGRMEWAFRVSVGEGRQSGAD